MNRRHECCRKAKGRVVDDALLEDMAMYGVRPVLVPAAIGRKPELGDMGLAGVLAHKAITENA